ncbi:ribosomal protein S2, flavodoxin-like domain-containing protein [Phlyctochytrium arcticum]|nr:ribosomal protein S2, flavodoxin-like domain-containing protein [Phlyctochytrium arcticum]
MAANLHLGHSPEVWNRNMLSYIYGERQGIHIINLEHTLVMLRRAINVTREVALRGGNIVFVGTRLFMHRITVEAAKKGDAYFVTKWVAGSITNKERVLRRSVGFDPDKPYVHLPDLLIVLDYANNASAVREANQMNIPVIAICDTDTDPQRVQYPIPANDDSAAGIELIAGALSLASKEGSRMRALFLV